MYTADSFCTPCRMHDCLPQYAHQYRGVEFPQPGDFHADPPVTAFTKGIFECPGSAFLQVTLVGGGVFRQPAEAVDDAGAKIFIYIGKQAEPHLISCILAGKVGAVGPGGKPGFPAVPLDLFPVRGKQGPYYVPPHVFHAAKSPGPGAPYYVQHDRLRLVVPVVRHRDLSCSHGFRMPAELAVPDLPAGFLDRNAHFCGDRSHIRPQDMQRYAQSAAEASRVFLVGIRLFTAQHVVYMYSIQFHPEFVPEGT